MRINIQSDPVLEKILNDIDTDDLPHAQYSTLEQLEALYKIAVKFKLKDAAENIKRVWFETETQ